MNKEGEKKDVKTFKETRERGKEEERGREEMRRYLKSRDCEGWMKKDGEKKRCEDI